MSYSTSNNNTTSLLPGSIQREETTNEKCAKYGRYLFITLMFILVIFIGITVHRNNHAIAHVHDLLLHTKLCNMTLPSGIHG